MRWRTACRSEHHDVSTGDDNALDLGEGILKGEPGFGVAFEVERPDVVGPCRGQRPAGEHGTAVMIETDVELVTRRADPAGFAARSIEPRQLRAIGLRLKDQRS